MQLNELSEIFITHLHSDHYLELGPLIHTAWTAGLKTRIDVWGPAGIEQFLTSMQADIELRIEDEGRPVLQDLVRIRVIEARALALNHLIPSDDPTYTKANWIDAVKPFWDGELHIGNDGLRIPLPG